MSKVNSNPDLEITEVHEIDDMPSENLTTSDTNIHLGLSPEQKIDAHSINSNSKNKNGQMTFDDFKLVKIVSKNKYNSNNKINNNNSLLRRTNYTAVSILKKKADDALKRKNSGKNNTKMLDNNNNNNKEFNPRNESDMNQQPKRKKTKYVKTKNNETNEIDNIIKKSKTKIKTKMILHEKDDIKLDLDSNYRQVDKNIDQLSKTTKLNRMEKRNKSNNTTIINKITQLSKDPTKNQFKKSILETRKTEENGSSKVPHLLKSIENNHNEEIPKKYKPKSQNSITLLNLKPTLTKINEKDLYTKNWCSAIPLPNSLYNVSNEHTQKTQFEEFWKNKCSIFLKPRPYAGKIIKIMSFINKFGNYLNTKELLTLSFQDFENGLNINENTKEISEIKQCQDKMNYLFYVLLRLLFDNVTEPATLNHFLTLNSPFRKYIIMLRKYCFEWGIVKEWRSIESGGFFTPGLDKIGLLALNPTDKLIILDSLIVYLLVQCPLIHNTIQDWNHDKKDLGVKDDSFYATRYLLEGLPQSLKSFELLCDHVQFHLERKRINMIKKKRPMKEEFKYQCKILRECKDLLNNLCLHEDRSKAIISLYEKWILLFKGLILDNPLSNPYDNNLYSLRLLDFFIGNIPGVGEFYLPQLHIPHSSNDFNFFKDAISLLKLFEKFNSKKIEKLTLFEEFYGTVSSQFKVLFYDKRGIISKLLSDSNKNNTLENTYWYEISNDTKSLQIFIDKLGEFIDDYGTDCNLINDETEADFLRIKGHIVNLRDYLSNTINILREIEDSRELCKTIEPGRRKLRSSSRREHTSITKERYEVYETGEYDIEKVQKIREEEERLTDSNYY